MTQLNSSIEYPYPVLPAAANETPAEESFWIGIDEAAASLKMERTTLYRQRKYGRIAPREIHLGGAVRWRRAEWEAWLAAGTPEARDWHWNGERRN